MDLRAHIGDRLVGVSLQALITPPNGKYMPPRAETMTKASDSVAYATQRAGNKGLHER